MNCKLIILFLFLLSIGTASAYIEPRNPYIVESSVEGVTEDENGNIIITDHGCFLFVNTTFHYKYGFEKIDTVLAVVKDPAGRSLDFEYMDLNQTSTKEGYTKVVLEIPGENRTAGTYTIRYVLDGVALDKVFLTSSVVLAIEPIEEEIEETEINISLDDDSSISAPLPDEHELNIRAPSQDEVKTTEIEEPVQEQTEISSIFFMVAALSAVALIILRRDGY